MTVVSDDAGTPKKTMDKTLDKSDIVHMGITDVEKKETLTPEVRIVLFGEYLRNKQMYRPTNLFRVCNFSHD